jgi:hypothetical protein
LDPRREVGRTDDASGIGGMGPRVSSCEAGIGAIVGMPLAGAGGPAAGPAAAPLWQQRSQTVSITGFQTFLVTFFSVRTSTFTVFTQLSHGGPQIFL